MSGSRAPRLLLVAAALLSVLAGSALTALPAVADEQPKVLLLLDVSGSMNEKVSSGGTKLAAAKRALKRVAAALPEGTQVGLRVYGSKIAEPKAQNPAACKDTTLVLPIAPLQRSAMNAAVDKFTAKGETPIAYSLGKAVDDLGDSGKRVVVLISDGEETCDGDPCPVARKLADKGVDLQFNAIGLAVNSKARKQLECIADAGDGTYYDADNTGDLDNALRRITQRALRPFQLSGTPVTGTETADDAPAIQVGQFKDRYDNSGTPRFYRVTRQTPGATITASLASIVRPAFMSYDNWRLSLTTVDGQVCGTANPAALGQKVTLVLSGAASSSEVGPNGATPPDRCSTDPQLLLSLDRRAPSDTRKVPVEILIAEEPPITNLAALPAAVGSYDGKAKKVSVAGPTQTVVGGTSFSNATEIRAGNVRDSVAVGETVLYRIHLDVGQTLRVTAETPAAKSPTILANAEAITPRLLLLAPSRMPLAQSYVALQGHDRRSITAGTPQVRVRNRELPAPALTEPPQAAFASVAGDYFVALELEPLQAQLNGRVLQIRLDVAVDGTASGQPEYAAASASPSPSASVSPSGTTPSGSAPASPSSTAPGIPGTSSGGVGWVLLVVAGVVLAGGFAALGVVLRRRRLRAGRPAGGNGADPKP